ncbi:hypothetical protein [uncultured Kordia sp.]|uniref:hypothetical protein n=1 Tax=uncultured Kordia sp. TaxID=507699 RepID=UPI00261F9B0E|nr:hypothetical protein [uncultured Kordia sp.]
MKKNISRKLLAVKKSSIAQLNERKASALNGGSSYTSGTFTYTNNSLLDNCDSYFCVPPM